MVNFHIIKANRLKGSGMCCTFDHSHSRCSDKSFSEVVFIDAEKHFDLFQYFSIHITCLPIPYRYKSIFGFNSYIYPPKWSPNLKKDLNL